MRDRPPPKRSPRTSPEIRERLRETLLKAGPDEPADAVLLSGGLDSSIAAFTQTGLWSKAYCVTLPKGPDFPYSEAVAEHLGLHIQQVRVTLEGLKNLVPPVAKRLATFDPMRVRNAVIPYVALKEARREGLDTIVTGDGADELFAGYSFMARMDPPELDAYREHLVEKMRFSTLELAHELGLEARSPFLEERVQRIALELSPEDLVHEHDGVAWGKWILREAFQADLPSPVLWQRKDPIQRGSGSEALTQHYEDTLTEAEFTERSDAILDEDGVRIRDAEHLAYYEAYRDEHPPPRELQADSDEDRCDACGAPLRASYCRTCGHDLGEPQ